MKLEIVVERSGIPIGKATDSANEAEVHLLPVALDNVPEALEIEPGTPLLLDAAYDSDPLRDDLEADGLKPVAPHRKNRVKPSRNDGRVFRRYKRRYIVERTFSWLHSFRRVMVRHERIAAIYDCFVSMACALLAISKLEL